MLSKMNKPSIVLLISLITATVLYFNPVYATTTIYVDPPSIIDPTMDIGRHFNVTLCISGVADMFAWSVRLDYNSMILNATRAWQPTWDTQYVFYGKSSVRPAPSFTVDYIWIVDSLLSLPTFTGSGKLAIIEFQVMGKGSTILDINNIDTYPLDYDVVEISTTKTNGYFENVSPATMFVDPPKIVDPTLVPSNNFNISIKIANATNVNSFEFKLGCNTSVLHTVDVILGDFFPSATTWNTTDNVVGYVIFNATLTSPPPRNGTGTLAIITFHVEGFGDNILNLTDTKLADQAGSALPQTDPVDGYFNNVLFGKLYVDPPEIIDPLLKPPKIFSVDIVIDDVEDLYGYEFKLSYDTRMLTTISVMIHPVLNETNFTTSMMVDDETGQIWIKVRYYSPANPITTYSPESLVTLTFKVDAIGSSALDLYDTVLLDSAGGLIVHQPTDGFVMTLIRDVAIVDVVPSTSFVYAGALVDINVTAKNIGNATETFDVKAYYNSTLIGTQNVTNLATNAESTLTFTWNTSGVSDGIYTIKGNATFVPYEFNTTNNEYTDGTVEVMTRIRDVAILNVTGSPNATYVGWPVNITVVAENQGMDPENITVSVYWNDTNLIGKQNVTNLPPNATVTLTFIWGTTNTTECHRYKISANATILPFEMDTSDNKLDDGYVKIKIMGDINSDGKVDIRDLAILSQAFGSYVGHPRWNPDADLNRDGRVDIRDLAMGASNYGRTCP